MNIREVIPFLSIAKSACGYATVTIDWNGAKEKDAEIALTLKREIDDGSPEKQDIVIHGGWEIDAFLGAVDAFAKVYRG